MKRLLFLFSALCIVMSSFGQTGNLKGLQLKGKVRSLKTQETYRYKKSGVFTEWENTYSREYDFDKTGNTTEFKEFIKDGSMSYRIAYLHKPKEKKTELTYFYKDSKATTTANWLYDSKGQKTEESSFRDGILTRRYTFTYNDQGNTREIMSYKADGTLSSKTTWSHDAKGRAAGFVIETPGYANSSRKFVLDDKGNTIEESWYNGKGVINFRFVRSYDDRGNMIREIKYKGNDTTAMDTVIWRYEYDKAGNWTKRTESSSDGTDFHIEDRVILYY